VKPGIAFVLFIEFKASGMEWIFVTTVKKQIIKVVLTVTNAIQNKVANIHSSDL